MKPEFFRVVLKNTINRLDILSRKTRDTGRIEIADGFVVAVYRELLGGIQGTKLGNKFNQTLHYFFGVVA